MDPHSSRRASYQPHSLPPPPPHQQSHPPSHPPSAVPLPPHAQHPPPPGGHYPPVSASPSTIDHRQPPQQPQYHPPPPQSQQQPPPPQQQPQQPPPPGHHHPYQHPHQQPPLPPGPQQHHHAQHPQQGPAGPPHHPPPPQQHHYSGPPPPPPPQSTSSGPALPPIVPPTEQNNLPPIRHQSTPSHEPPREGSQDHSQSYNNHNRSGHATPSVVGRPYPPHDRTPTTPSVPQPFAAPAPPPGPDGAQPPPPPPHMMDHGAHHNGYPPNNVVPMGMPAPHGAPPGPPPPPPPGPHAPPPHHEGPPAYMTPMMDHHGQYGQGAMYGAPNYGPASGNMYNAQKRKQMRATQACEQCRQRKQKCDEGNPCSFCKENALACQYRDTPPAKTDKNMEKLLSYMEQHQSGLAELTAKIESFDRRLNRVEQNNGGAAAFPPELDPDALREQEEEAKRKSNLGDHRTAPHKLLLLWPSVRPLLSEAGIKFNDGYVMEAEDRGMLRLWTVGEAADEFDGTQGGGPASPARSDESGEGGLIPTPSAEGRWGAAMSTTSPEIRTSEAASSTMGGRKSNGELDLDANTINTLYESYMRHMHIMHPFLDKRRLRRMVDNFIRRYATGRSRATFAVGNSALDADTRPMKRQRSNGSTAIPVGEPEYRREVREPIERSPGNAVILLVLALGRICLHKDPLPGPVQSSKLQTNSVISHSLGMRVPGNTNTSFSASSPGSAVDIKPSPMSPLSTPHTQPTPPSENGYRFDPRSRRASTDAAQAGGDPRKNMDVLPGLAYYAKAAEILGEQGDGNDLVHAQMFLLAGLYKGQLARVRESMSWITMAGRAILTLLDRYKLYNDNYWTAYGDVRKLHERGQARIKDTRQALIVLASWTALQLETDILAEMKLPPSGIQSIEQLLLMPHKSPEDESYAGLEPDGSPDDYDNILMYYCAQLFLRRRLNKAHTEIYGPDCMDQPLSQVQEMLKGHEAILAGWRESLPVGLRWNDDDPPPSEILPARLRAKYWGARYVINRPFLDYALHIMPHVKDDTHTVEAAAKDAHGNPRDRADIHLFKAIQQMGDSEIWQAAKRCIDAAMHSTVAFDGMPDRLIVTNIHGTAHAQFGNMLVLSATMHTHYLKTLVDHGKFKKLLLRTIKFLRRLAPISPTCQADCLILEKFNNTLFPGSQEEPGTYRNQGYENDGALAAVAGPATL